MGAVTSTHHCWVGGYSELDCTAAATTFKHIFCLCLKRDVVCMSYIRFQILTDHNAKQKANLYLSSPWHILCKLCRVNTQMPCSTRYLTIKLAIKRADPHPPFLLPSDLSYYCVKRDRSSSGRAVSTSMPFCVTRMVCSHWADNL